MQGACNSSVARTSTRYLPRGMPSHGACRSVTPLGDGTAIDRTALYDHHVHGNPMEGGAKSDTCCKMYMYSSTLSRVSAQTKIYYESGLSIPPLPTANHIP